MNKYLIRSLLFACAASMALPAQGGMVARKKKQDPKPDAVAPKAEAGNRELHEKLMKALKEADLSEEERTKVMKTLTKVLKEAHGDGAVHEVIVEAQSSDPHVVKSDSRVFVIGGEHGEHGEPMFLRQKAAEHEAKAHGNGGVWIEYEEGKEPVVHGGHGVQIEVVEGEEGQHEGGEATIMRRVVRSRQPLEALRTKAEWLGRAADGQRIKADELRVRAEKLRAAAVDAHPEHGEERNMRVVFRDLAEAAKGHDKANHEVIELRRALELAKVKELGDGKWVFGTPDGDAKTFFSIRRDGKPAQFEWREAAPKADAKSKGKSKPKAAKAPKADGDDMQTMLRELRAEMQELRSMMKQMRKELRDDSDDDREQVGVREAAPTRTPSVGSRFVAPQAPSSFGGLPTAAVDPRLYHEPK